MKRIGYGIAIVTLALMVVTSMGQGQITSQSPGSGSGDAIAQKAAAFRIYRQQSREHVDALLETVRAQNPSEAARTMKDKHGYLKHFGAPPGAPVPLDPSLRAASAEERAMGFIQQYGAAFGIYSPQTGFTAKRVDVRGNRTYVRMEQWYDDVPVFGGETVIQLSGQNELAAALTDLMVDTYDLDLAQEPTIPTVPREDVEVVALFEVIDMSETEVSTGQRVAPLAESDLRITRPAERVIFDPGIIGETGRPTLAWKVRVDSSSLGAFSGELIIEAHTGELLFYHSLIFQALTREIYDGKGNNDSEDPSTYVGDVIQCDDEGTFPPADCTVLADLWVPDIQLNPDLLDELEGLSYNIQQAYDYFADPNTHDYDGLDGVDGRIYGVVNWNTEEDAYYVVNYSHGPGPAIVFGRGGSAQTDDYVGHEYMHGVTDHISNLSHSGEAGAINESMSDVFGEMVDIQGGKIADTAEWLFAEDVNGGWNRSLANPPADGNSVDQYDPFDPGPDVHFNAGIGNKLFYLLSEGGSHNTYTLTALADPPGAPTSMDQAAALYFESQYLLTTGSSYFYFGFALQQAGVNLEWSYEERQKVKDACIAVEIVSSPALTIWGDSATVPLLQFRSNGDLLLLSGVLWEKANGPGDQVVITGGNCEGTYDITWCSEETCEDPPVVLTFKDEFCPSPDDGEWLVYDASGNPLLRASTTAGLILRGELHEEEGELTPDPNASELIIQAIGVTGTEVVAILDDSGNLWMMGSLID